jgi:hypothetical protein
MELRDFVSQSLQQIIEGVAIAQKASAQHGGRVNPDNLSFAGAANSGQSIIHYDDRNNIAQSVEFDVAVTATESSVAGGKAGISIYAAQIGGKGERTTESSTVSRIRFKVLVMFPAGA